MSCVLGFVWGLVVAVIMVLIGWTPIGFAIIDFLSQFFDSGDGANDALLAFFLYWAIAAIVGVIVWIVVAWWSEKRAAKKEEVVRDL